MPGGSLKSAEVLDNNSVNPLASALIGQTSVLSPIGEGVFPTTTDGSESCQDNFPPLGFPLQIQYEKENDEEVEDRNIFEIFTEYTEHEQLKRFVVSNEKIADAWEKFKKSERI